MDRQENEALKIARDALDTDPGDRDRFVAQRCSGDEELHARVRSMLERIRVAERSSDFATVAFRPDESSERISYAGLEDALVGGKLGPYRVAERIGHGGMGVVYRGVREGADFAQEVAIKLIRRGFDFDDVHARFLRERRILARLSHPNLARFIDGGVADGGRPWFALEFVRGEAITSWCDTRRLTVRSRLQLFIEVCSAVQYAHTQLVIHRDIKPGNVLVDGSGAVRLLDFGVAGLIAGDANADGVASTIGGSHAMTPEYAAPEQFAGAVAGVAADVYSLGVLAYELITGVLPYVIDRHDQQAAGQIVATTPPQSMPIAIGRTAGGLTDAVADQRLTARRTNASAFRRVVRGDLARIIEKSLAKEPEHRYPTVQAFSDDLSRWLAGAPVNVTGNRLGYRARKFVQRNRVAVGLAGLAFALLITGVVGIVWQSREAVREAERATAVKTFVLSLFDSNVPGAAIDTVPSTRDLLSRGVKRVQTEMLNQPLLRADMLTTLGRVHNQLSLYPESEPLLRQALALEEADGRASRADRAVTLRELGLSLIEQQRHSEASDLLRRALRLLDENDDAAEAAIRQLLGIALVGDQKKEDGLRESVAAIALWRAVENPPGDKVANALADYGAALTNSGKPEDSLVPYGEALAILRPLHSGGHVDIAIIASNIGVSMMMLGRFEEALEPLREAVEVDRNVYGNKHRALASHLSNLGSAQVATGNFAAAEEAFREGVAVRIALYGEDSAETAKSKYSLAAVLLKMERYAEVENVMRSAIASLDKAEGDWRQWIVICESNLANVLLNLNRPGEASPSIARAIRLYAELDPDKDSRMSLDLQSMVGELANSKGQYEVAEAHFQDLLNRSLGNLPASAAGLPDRYLQVANVKARLGKLAEAKENFEEAMRLETERAGNKSATMISIRLGLAEILIKLHDTGAAREQLALVMPAVEALQAGHSLRQRAADVGVLLKE